VTTSARSRQTGRTPPPNVIYDGSPERDPEVTALYRYYEDFAPDPGRANPNVRVTLKP